MPSLRKSLRVCAAIGLALVAFQALASLSVTRPVSLSFRLYVPGNSGYQPAGGNSLSWHPWPAPLALVALATAGLLAFALTPRRPAPAKSA